jgi:hypothetical protein
MIYIERKSAGHPETEGLGAVTLHGRGVWLQWRERAPRRTTRCRWHKARRSVAWNDIDIERKSAGHPETEEFGAVAT